MRAKEFLSELRKKKVVEPKAGDETPHDWNPGWEDLNWLKEQALKEGQRMVGAYQLFVPRGTKNAQTPRDRRLNNLSNKYAYDDEGNLKPDYARYEQPPKELKGTEPENELAEAAPILHQGKAISPPGHNKPSSGFWTSTATKEANGAFSSDWSRWIKNNHPTWWAPKGYLYKVKPGALILELNGDHDVDRIYHAFERLGRTGQPPEYYRNSSEDTIRSIFPWDQIIKHFDGVRHRSSYGRNGFMYGWDVESTVWFDTSFLTLVGEVPVAEWTDDDR